jgi:cobalamin biosynthesis protein CobW
LSTSLRVEVDAIDDPAAFATRLGETAAAHGVLRAKGFLDVAGKRRRLVVQAVGTRVDRHFDRDWRADETRESRLVVIGLSPLDRAAVEAAIRG